VLSPFERSAEFYDELYEEKDYAAEADYVDGLIRAHSPAARSLLDLGCGTGRHAIHFVERGYSVVGVDRSADMIAKADGRCERLPRRLRERVAFDKGDIRTLRLGRRFDAVAALFHVVSYQISNDDLLALLATAKTHLQPNGVFVFDCWYGPAVLSDPPAVRTKHVFRRSQRLTRIAEPVMRVNDNVVEVNYRFVLENEATRFAEAFRETHRMRYFFVPELLLALQIASLEPVTFSEWMSAGPPGRGTWSLSAIARQVS
jgi:SAM-dependent methyltransferase